MSEITLKRRPEIIQAIKFTGANLEECLDLICRGGSRSREVGYSHDGYGRPIADPLAVRRSVDPEEWIIRRENGDCTRITECELFSSYEHCPSTESIEAKANAFDALEGLVKECPFVQISEHCDGPYRTVWVISKLRGSGDLSQGPDLQSAINGAVHGGGGE